MDLSDLLDRDAVAVRGAAGKRQALAVLADVAHRRFDVAADEAMASLLEREQAASTGIGAGVALPHARLPGLTRLRAVFLRLEHPVAFDAVDDAPVDLLFALFAPPSAVTEHLRALARASRLLRRPELREGLRQARSPDAIYALLTAQAEASAA